MSASYPLNLEELQTAIHAALASWGKPPSDTESSLNQLLLVQNKCDPQDQNFPPARRQAVDQVLLDGLQKLEEQDKVGAAVLHGRFRDGKITRQVAQEMHASPDQVNRWQRAALEQLAQLLYHQEQALRAELTATLLDDLPPAPYSELFGFGDQRQAILEQLIRPESSWILAITGIGGIGKTSLADFVARQAAYHLAYGRILWLRVENQPLSGAVIDPEKAYGLLLADLARKVLPGSGGDASALQASRLRQILQASPHLIVVDNLETAVHIDYFAQQLAAFTNPSRFLLTSRARPSGNTAVYVHSLPELTAAEAAALLRRHAADIGLPELADAPDETYAAIYAVTGGNPLALKLVASLAATLPLPQILADLPHSRLGPVEELYRHIYWRTWRTLSAEAQMLLQAMPLVATSGALPLQMQAISGLEDGLFWTAVQELTTRSLLEIQGSLQQRRYGIHRLTETFLRTEIIHWPEQGS